MSPKICRVGFKLETQGRVAFEAQGSLLAEFLLACGVGHGGEVRKSRGVGQGVSFQLIG